jgi:hypothetical protein
MPDEVKASGTTNPEAGTSVEVEANCSVLWGAAHQFAYLRLSENLEPNTSEVDLLDCYYTRARRIAATYARMYLEQEEGFDKSKKGRFYWMALGAFASKTVACLLDNCQIKRTFDTGRHIWDKELVVISEGLGLGNLWLFMDVSIWHWAYANMPQHYFEGMNCEAQRNATELPKDGPLETVTQNLEWAKYALEKINDLKPTDYMTQGMKLVEEIEEMDKDKAGIPEKQFEHLAAVANHEQLAILQPLIYDHSVFAKWIKKQRNNWFYNSISPAYELVFSASCDEEDDRLKSEAPDDMRLEEAGTLEDAKQDNPKTRMGWIGQAAEQFHNLMQGIDDPTTTKKMEAELLKIASWVDEPDFSEHCISVATVSGFFK